MLGFAIEGWGPARVINGGLEMLDAVGDAPVSRHRRQACLSGSRVSISWRLCRWAIKRGWVEKAGASGVFSGTWDPATSRVGVMSRHDIQVTESDLWYSERSETLSEP